MPDKLRVGVLGLSHDHIWDNLKALNSSADSVIQSLEHQQSNLSPSDIANGFQGLLGNLNVLVVTGDYYDVNYVSQTNFVSNGNTVGMTGSQGDL